MTSNCFETDDFDVDVIMTEIDKTIRGIESEFQANDELNELVKWDQLASSLAMVDIDKIVREAETRHDYKEHCKASSLQLKDFSFAALLLLVGFSPIIFVIIKTIVSLII